MPIGAHAAALRALAETGPDEEYYTDANSNTVLFANFDETTTLFSLQGDCSQGPSNAKTDLGVTNCLQLDGTGDFAQSVSTSLALSIGSSEAASFEMWLRPTLTLGSTTVGYMHLGSGPWGFMHYGTGDESYIYFAASGSAPGVAGLGNELTVNSWNHLAWARDGSGNCALFQNGTRLNTSSSTAAKGGSAQLFVGKADGTFGGNAMQGQIGPIRCVVGANVYDPTASSITQPTTKFSHEDY